MLYRGAFIFKVLFLSPFRGRKKLLKNKTFSFGF